MTKFLCLDLEISTPIPPGTTDWATCRPYGVSCVVTKGSDHVYPLMWANANFVGFGTKMMTLEIGILRTYLTNMVRNGYTLLSFNGAGFDFNVLMEEETLIFNQEQIPVWKDLALNHIDIYFQIFAQKGYCKGLNHLAKAHGLTGKAEGVNGALAPQMWLDGRYHEVLDYCASDVEMTLELARIGEELGFLQWQSNSGSMDSVSLPDGWLTVAEALKLPEPNTSWQGAKAWKRDKFTGWLNE